MEQLKKINDNEIQNYMKINKEVQKVKGKTVKEYYQEYYNENKEDYVRNRERYNERHDGSYIYFHISEDAEVIYIGATSNMGYRQSAHMTNDSNLKMTFEEYQDLYNFSIITYKDFTKYNLNKQDLKFLEHHFKYIYNEVRKGNKVHYLEHELSRSVEELINIAIREEMLLYPIDKYLD
jgi:hypothetical protein